MKESLTFDDVYREIPGVDKEDPEFLLDLFKDAKRMCHDKAKELTLKNLFFQTKLILNQMSSEERRQHYDLDLSITEPSIQILRWFPPIAEKLEIDIGFENLTDYVSPNVTMALNLFSWNSACRIIKAVPELAEKLKSYDKKPEISLLDYGDERGLVAAIIGENEKLVVKHTLHPDESRIANLVSDVVGPKVFFSTDDWIVEEYIEGQTAEQILHHPQLVGQALAVALSKTHQLGLIYNDRFDRGHVRINSKTDKASLVDWSEAEETYQFWQDIKRATSTLKNWFTDDRESMLEAFKSFKTSYARKNQ